MDRIIKSVAIILGISSILIIAPFCYLKYKTRWEVAIVDKAIAPHSEYTLKMYSVGEPYWPFGSANGQLILEKGKTLVTSVGFEIANDGARFNATNWDVSWYSDRVEIVLLGKEQCDEHVTIYFDGSIERHKLATINKVDVDKIETVEKSETEEKWTDNNVNRELDDVEIMSGYKTIYKLYADTRSIEFDVDYGASENSSRCTLQKNAKTIDYIAYNGKSENGKSGIYVRYQVKIDDNGSILYNEGSIVDIYAYVFATNEVVCSGKKQWDDEETDEFVNVTIN